MQHKSGLLTGRKGDNVKPGPAWGLDDALAENAWLHDRLETLRAALNAVQRTRFSSNSHELISAWELADAALAGEPSRHRTWTIYVCPDCGSIAVEPDDSCCTTGPDHDVRPVALTAVEVVER